ncbi:glycosyltransferase family 9 protein [Fusobacterium varium]|nr:glycosyltransferase family 9 protein [Fusobacterium varium]
MKILIIRFKQIGDAVLSSVICNTLKKSFPEAEIDYVVYEHIAPLFKNHPYIDNIISITKDEQKNPLKYIAKTWKVTRKKYDIVIDIMSTPKSEMFTLFSLKSKYRIGRRKKYRGFTYTHKISEPVDSKDKVDKFLKILAPLEEEYKILYDNNYIINISQDEKENMRRKMIKAGIDFSKPVFICATNSRRPEKIYPPKKMKEVINKVIEEFNSQVILFYSPDEEAFIKEIHRELNNNKNIFSNVETTSIRELAALISNCDMFFGNEGGPRHIAQSLDIPSFAIFSPKSSKKEWLANPSKKHQGVEPKDIYPECGSLSYKDCYSLIQPDYIVNKIKDIYNNFIKNKEEEKNEKNYISTNNKYV